MSNETVLGPQQILHLWDTSVNEPYDKYPLLDGDKLHFARAIEQAVLQSAEVQALRMDAERYRWLRDICGIVEYKQAFGSIGSGMIPSGKRLDVAIDAEMEKQS